jgi:hypothetical protein
MYGCPEDIWYELAELPGSARRIWRRAFWRAWPQAGGDCRRAAAMAWQAFALEAKGCGATGAAAGKGRAGEGRMGRALIAITAKIAAGWFFVRKFLGVRGRQPGCGPATRGCHLENLETVFAEAVAKGWLKPEQRPWAEVLAKRDGQALREFVELAAAAAEYQAGWGGGRPQGMR